MKKGFTLHHLQDKIETDGKATRNGAGFTLIELIVAVALFITVLSVVLTLLNTALKAHRRVIALQNVEENARFLLEFMAKEIRMSTINSSTETSLNITRSDRELVIYTFSGGRLERTTSEPSDSGPISSDQVIVNGRFYAEGIGDGDRAQPKVTITMGLEGIGAKIEEKAQINVQTTISQRNLDL